MICDYCKGELIFVCAGRLSDEYGNLTDRIEQFSCKSCNHQYILNLDQGILHRIIEHDYRQ